MTGPLTTEDRIELIRIWREVGVPIDTLIDYLNRSDLALARLYAIRARLAEIDKQVAALRSTFPARMSNR